MGGSMDTLYNHNDFWADLLIVQAQTRSLLVKQEGDSFSLPGMRLPWIAPDSAEPIQHAASRLMQRPAAVLRLMGAVRDENNLIRRVYLLEDITPADTLPSGLVWLQLGQLAHLKPPAATTELIRAALHWLDDTSANPDWMHPGWFQKASDWMIDLADRMDMRPTGCAIQQNMSGRAAVLYLPTDDAGLELHAIPESFNYEPVLTRILSLRCRDHAPEVRAVDVERGWMLLRHSQGKPLSQIADPERWLDAVRQLATIQRGVGADTPALVALGLPDHHLHHLRGRIGHIMDDLPPELDQVEQKQLRAFAPSLRRLIDELSDLPIPTTLIHGSLQAGHILNGAGGKIRLLNWRHAAVSHPFFDLVTFLTASENLWPAELDEAHLRDAYLAMWRDLLQPELLRESLTLAQTLAPLQQAIYIYERLLLMNGGRWRREAMPRFVSSLRRVLKNATAEVQPRVMLTRS